MHVPLLVLALSSSVSAVSLKGVAPQNVALYEKPIAGSSPARWKCLNSSQEIPHSAVNDNYCDCDDGTDEPGTGACPTGQYYCANKGHVGAYIRASRVNDGLCEPECCDGSDEAPGICPDICHVVGEEYRRAHEAERKLRKTGSKIRSTYIAYAQKVKAELEQSIQRLTAEVEVKRAEEARAREIWEHTASLDAERLELRKQSPTYQVIQEHVDLLHHLTAEGDSLRERIAALEQVLINLKAGYNPNYQDMAVLEAVRGWDGLKPAEPSDESEASSEADEEASAPVEAIEEPWTDAKINELKSTDPLSVLLEHERHIGGPSSEEVTSILFAFDQYVPEPLLPAYESVRDVVLTTLTTFGIYHPTSAPPGGNESEQKKSAHQRAENQLRDAENKLSREQGSLDKLFDTKKGFGPYGEWRKLQDTCISKDTGEYTYTICFFGSATQKSNSGHNQNSLGTFKAWSRNPEYAAGTVEYYSQQYYENGAKCWNGPERSVKLDLTCGTENAILTIAEPEKCEYHFTGTSPALCWPDEEIEAGVKRASKEDL